MSIWKTIQEALESEGIKAYPPGLKTGECKKEYVVIRVAGGNQVSTFSSEYVYYDFLLYVPANKYTMMDDFEARVKEVLATKCYPMLMPTGSLDPDFYDNTIKAYMRSFMYRNVRRNKHL